MSKIDEKTSVPLGWVISGFGAALGVAIVGTFWVSSVNERLARIEDKLGIVPYADISILRSANAHEVKK